MTATVKPIETVYQGYRFRSRLEARWAVFFDALGLAWEYEKEGYDLGPAGWYLPDFWFPDLRHWAEVKPEDFDQEALRKCQALAVQTGCPVTLLRGLPDGLPHHGRFRGPWFHGDDAAWATRLGVAAGAARGARFEHGERGAGRWGPVEPGPDGLPRQIFYPARRA